MGVEGPKGGTTWCVDLPDSAAADHKEQSIG